MNIHRFDDMLHRSAKMNAEARSMPITGFSVTSSIRDLLSTNNLRSRDDCSVLTDPNCNKSVSSASYSLPIALAVIIPIVGISIALIFLHRRHVRKQRQEDAADRHASLDFGLGEVHRVKKAEKNGTQPIEDDFGDEKRPRQLSMDMASPYLLPPELQGSQDTLRSLSRAGDNKEDPYRPVTQYLSDAGSTNGRRNHDAASIRTGSSGPSNIRDHSAAPSSRNRMSNAGPMTFPHPPRIDSSMASASPVYDQVDPFLSHFDSPAPSVRQLDLVTPIPQLQISPPTSSPLPRKPISPVQEAQQQTPVESDMSQHATSYALADHPVIPEMPAASISTTKPLAIAPIAQSAVIENVNDRESSDYGDGIQITPPSPERAIYTSQRYSMDVPPEEFSQAGLRAPGFDARRLSMTFRPLPPDSLTVDVEDPEMRANRIRSFYKEYFDESKPLPAGQYIEDYDQNYMNTANYSEDAYFDPRQNSYAMPYAEPINRRAMTPPPHAQRYMGQAGPPRAPFMGQQSRSRNSSLGGQSRPRDGSRAGPRAPFMNDGPRPHSSASNRAGPRAHSSASQQQGRGQSRGRPLPPPSDLTTLPTPAKLRDDSFALYGASDFAPPTTFRDRQYGRSESPLGERRAYSPSVPAFQPLVSSFDEIAPVPSPHLLRKSGTFTSLDFAPPRKFNRDDGTASDAGSIRSTRSGVSQMHNDAIRKGAYRVSRLPPDAVPTKEHMNDILKPSWGMRPGEGGAM